MPQIKPSLFTIGCLALAVVTVVTTGCKTETEIQTGQIVGGSMFPALKGKHYCVDCPQCTIRFACDIEQSEKRTCLVCPNCGFAEVPASNAISKDAQRVEIELLDKAALASGKLQRWDLVAFRVPDSTGELGVKRVVGLPGEEIEIRRGNLFCGGKMLRKSLSLQRRMRIPVYDSIHFDPNNRRWVPQTDASAWSRLGENLKWKSPAVTENDNPGFDSMDWVTYRHKRSYAIGAAADGPANIEDSYGFNQALTRDLNETGDLMLEIDVSSDANFVFVICFNRLENRCLVQIDSGASTLKVKHGDSKFVNVPISDALFQSSGGMKIECSTIDDQLTVAIDRKIIFESHLESEGDSSEIPVMLGGGNGEFTIDRIQLWRDVYYLGPSGEPGSGHQFDTTEDGWILLGDNVPVSIDSRHWQEAELLPKNIVGRVTLPDER